MMKLSRFLAALAVALPIVGCGEPDNGPPPPVRTQESVNAQIEKIKNDPNMSQQAKDAAIGAIRSSFESSQRQAESMKQNNPQRK